MATALVKNRKTSGALEENRYPLARIFRTEGSQGDEVSRAALKHEFRGSHRRDLAGKVELVEHEHPVRPGWRSLEAPVFCRCEGRKMARLNAAAEREPCDSRDEFRPERDRIVQRLTQAIKPDDGDDHRGRSGYHRLMISGCLERPVASAVGFHEDEVPALRCIDEHGIDRDEFAGITPRSGADARTDHTDKSRCRSATVRKPRFIGTEQDRGSG